MTNSNQHTFTLNDIKNTLAPALVPEIVPAIEKALEPKFKLVENNLKSYIHETVERAIDDLAQATAKGFKEVDQRFTEVDKRLNRVENQLDKMVNVPEAVKLHSHYFRGIRLALKE